MNSAGYEESRVASVKIVLKGTRDVESDGKRHEPAEFGMHAGTKRGQSVLRFRQQAAKYCSHTDPICALTRRPWKVHQMTRTDAISNTTTPADRCKSTKPIGFAT